MEPLKSFVKVGMLKAGERLKKKEERGKRKEPSR
jgi:hypothetical protein